MANSICDGIQNLDGWKSNVIATAIAISFCALTIAYYSWNAVSIMRTPPLLHNRVDSNFKAFLQAHKLDIGSLSGVMASALGLILIYAAVTPWPQPLEGAALVLIVFAQLSALIWQDRKPDGIFKLLAVRVPDLMAVGVAITTLFFTEKLYADTTPNSFSRKHEPMTAVYISTALSSFSLLLGLAREILFIKNELKQHRVQDRSPQGAVPLHSFRPLAYVEVLFVIQEFAIVVAALKFGWAVFPQSCSPFRAEIIIAMITLVIGLIYSLLACCSNLFAETFKPIANGEDICTTESEQEQLHGLNKDERSKLALKHITHGQGSSRERA